MTREPNCITKVQNDHTKESWGWGSADLVSVERRGGPKAKAEGTAHRMEPQGESRFPRCSGSHRTAPQGESRFPRCTGSHRTAPQGIKSVPMVHRFTQVSISADKVSSHGAPVSQF